MSGEVAKAYLNWARWIIDCPFCGDGARIAYGAFREESLFTCPACGWECLVVFPAEAKEIMAVLIERPKLENRNWTPGEGIPKLLAENAAHIEGGEVKADGMV